MKRIPKTPTFEAEQKRYSCLTGASSGRLAIRELETD
jgi:hypothetical protein